MYVCVSGGCGCECECVRVGRDGQNVLAIKDAVYISE